MDTEDLQRNFEGYLNTALLWDGAKIYELEQCDLEDFIHVPFTAQVNGPLRLGKLVERFVFHQLANVTSCNILAENVQIQDGKRTIGELDTLIRIKDDAIHLEIIYKFYVFDPYEGNDELSHWIGPNRKDSLLQKLDKLKNKQLPLFYHPKTQLIIGDLNLQLQKIKQQVLFKAQLFLPLDYDNDVFYSLNPNCVQGFYIKRDELRQFQTAEFFIPEKLNWLMSPYHNVNWLHYAKFTTEVNVWLERRRSPLCWMKQNDVLRKFFIVWW